MRKSIVLVSSLAAISLVAGCAKPDLKAEAQKAIQAGYNAEDAGIVRKNATAAYSAHSSDCAFVDVTGKPIPNGTAVASATISAAFSLPNTTFKCNTKISDISLNNAQGTEATVTAARSTEVTVTRPGTTQQASGTVENVVRNYWVKEGQTWKIKREKQISMTRKRD